MELDVRFTAADGSRGRPTGIIAACRAQAVLRTNRNRQTRPGAESRTRIGAAACLSDPK